MNQVGARHRSIDRSQIYQIFGLRNGAGRTLAECNIGSVTPIHVEARGPAVKHTTTLASVAQWMNRIGRGPKEQLIKERVREMLGAE